MALPPPPAVTLLGSDRAVLLKSGTSSCHSLARRRQALSGQGEP